MKDIEEIIEVTNKYLKSEQIPETWGLTETGEPYRKSTNTGNVVPMSEESMRSYYKKYVAEWCDDTDTLEEDEQIEYIDFAGKMSNLHNEIVDAIIHLMEKHEVKEISLNEADDIDKGYALVAYDDVVELRVASVKTENNSLYLKFDNDDEWNYTGLNGDILWCSITSVYEAVYQYFAKKVGKKQHT